MTPAMFMRYAAVMVIFCAAASYVYARDLGTIGRTYPIIERDALEEIEERAKQVDWSSMFDKDRNAERIRNYQPKDLASLPRAVRSNVRMIDISYTLEFDIPDGKGGILYPKGFVFNPLDYITYPRTIVVINGSDRQQIAWFKSSVHATSMKAVLLITAGNYYDLSKELNRPVYYLTAGLARKLQLSATPCIVVQKGNLLEETDIDIQESIPKKPS
jgi:conjugal transfer pilus assembly protein TraW